MLRIELHVSFSRCHSWNFTIFIISVYWLWENEIISPDEWIEIYYYYKRFTRKKTYILKYYNFRNIFHVPSKRIIIISRVFIFRIRANLFLVVNSEFLASFHTQYNAFFSSSAADVFHHPRKDFFTLFSNISLNWVNFRSTTHSLSYRIFVIFQLYTKNNIIIDWQFVILHKLLDWFPLLIVNELY